MFEKELLTSLVAYNPVVQFRREAAAKAGLPPRRLSFTGVWNTFQSFFLKLSPAQSSEKWESRYDPCVIDGIQRRPASPPRSELPSSSPPPPPENDKVPENSPQKTNHQTQPDTQPMTTPGPLGASPPADWLANKSGSYFGHVPDPC